MKLIQPPSYASLRAQLNDSRAKAGLPPAPEEVGEAPRAEAPSHEGVIADLAAPDHTKTSSPRSATGRTETPPASGAPPMRARTEEAAAQAAGSALAARKVYKFRVPIPVAAPGGEFARLIEAYGAADAMGMILKSALDAWIAAYGPDSAVLDQPGYPTTGAVFGTTRRFAQELVADVRRRIDPYDRRADGFIAQRIAVSALSAYLGKG